MRFVSAIALSLLFAGAAAAQEVGPGPQPPNPALVPGMFRTICLDNLPNFANAEAQMLNSGLFLRNENSGVMFHQELNFSGRVKQLEQQIQCSVVFFSEHPVAQVQPMLEAARDAFQAEISGQHPGTTIDTISATGDSEGFHRMAIFVDNMR